jgi:riboflavin synthase
MFTGIIEGLGTVKAVTSSGEGLRLVINADFVMEGTRIGDSIAVDGACLTAVAVSGSRFEVDVSPETVSRTTLKTIAAGSRVNIERALRLADRLDGHLVSGHIDGTGRITYTRPAGNALWIGVAISETLSRYTITKGSVAVDGVSLTINNLTADGFELALIPHTAAVTTIGAKKEGMAVNIETDMIGKYVERFLKAASSGTVGSKQLPGVNKDFLQKTGFI